MAQQPGTPDFQPAPPAAPGEVGSDSVPRRAISESPVPPRPSTPATSPPASASPPWWQRPRFWVVLGAVLTVLCLSAIVLIWWDLHTITMAPVPIP